MTESMRPPIDHLDGDEANFETLAAFADDRLTPAERERVLQHLASCLRCRAIVAELGRAGVGRARPRWSRGFLPVAATLAIAAIGAGTYWMLRDTGSVRPAIGQPATPVPPGPVPAFPDTQAPQASPAGSPASSQRTTADGTRSVGVRTIAGKTFHLVAGEWIDEGYHLTDAFPVVDIITSDQLSQRSAAKAFAVLGPRYTVVIDGTVYRVALPPGR